MNAADSLPTSGPENIVFVINPSIWYQSMYPTGILCLSSYLDLKGFPSAILDSKLSPARIPPDRGEELILARLKELRPRIVCFSCTHREFDEVTRMNAAVKQFDPSIVTIVGGSQPTYRTSDFLDNGFDFVCVGEGEKTLHEFAREVQEGTMRWEGIDGLAWRKGQECVINRPRALMANHELNYDLIQAYRKIDDRYFDYNVETIRGMPLIGALLLTTRGCPYSCSFCGCNLIFGRKIRHRTLDSIEREVRFLKTHKKIEGLWIVDDTFTVDKSHAMAVAAILQKYGLIWGCQSRVNTLSDELVAAFKQNGCVQMDFGVESGSQRVLDEVIHKKTNISQVLTSFAIARKYGMRTLANFIIGLPTETRGDIEATECLADQIKADVYVFSIATPLPGTQLYEIVGENIRPQEYSSLNWNGSTLTEKLNKSEILNISQERQRLKKKYLLKSIFKSILSRNGLFFIARKNHRLKRIVSAIRFLHQTLFPAA